MSENSSHVSYLTLADPPYSISGRVLLGSLVVPGCNVTSQGRWALTNKNGQFRLTNILVPASKVVTVEAFKAGSVSASQQHRVNAATFVGVANFFLLSPEA
jgi:hypothetical protein